MGVTRGFNKEKKFHTNFERPINSWELKGRLWSRVLKKARNVKDNTNRGNHSNKLVKKKKRPGFCPERWLMVGGESRKRKAGGRSFNTLLSESRVGGG